MPETVIEFGTDGWRAIINEDFTFENVARVAQAIAQFINSSGRKEMEIYRLQSLEYQPSTSGLIVGYDTRFLSDKFAETAARVVAANDIPVYLVQDAAPTPAVAYAIKDKKTAGAIMITASHNPPEYNGVKFKPEYAGSALPEFTEEIEKYLGDIIVRNQEVSTEPRAPIEKFDPRPAYFRQVESLVNLPTIARAKFKVVADPMYGAGREWLRSILEEAGINVIEIHGELDPSFGGLYPEPMGKHIEPLMDAVRDLRADVGLALDGDADRLGAVDSRGRFINSHQIFSLLLTHLVRDRGWAGAVVKTFSTTQMVNILAEKYNLKLYETPIGFKHICRLMLAEDILIGGEESGGIGVKNHIPERDGILAGLLLLQIMASHGKTLEGILDDLIREVGFFAYDRRDYHFSDNLEKEMVLKKLKEFNPKEMSGSKVVGTKTLDGLKFFLEDGSWILFRASGTEPLIRVYAEAHSQEKVNQLLEEGEKIVS